MALDLSSETPIPFAEVPKLLPGRPHISTVYRWTFRGVRGHKLGAVLFGGRRFTTREEVARFIARISDQSLPAPNCTPSRSQLREFERADNYLTREGI